MRYEVFLDNICRMVSDRLGESADVSLHKVLKNNGMVLDGLVIRDSSSVAAPTIYLNSYYREAEQGMPLSRITDHILMIREQNPGIPEELLEASYDFKAAREHISYRLISRSRNSGLLNNVPHFPYLDLAVIFCLSYEAKKGGSMQAVIENHLLEEWHVKKEDLIPLAETYSPVLMPPVLMDMEETLKRHRKASGTRENESGEPAEGETAGEPDPAGLFPASGNPLYVLTNSFGRYGATSVLFPGILKELSEKLGDDLALIPSSVHEFLIIRKKDAFPDKELNEMIRSVNETDVLPEERLSDHAYYYSRADDCVWYPGAQTRFSQVPEVPESFS